MTAIGDYFRTALLIDDRLIDSTGHLEPLAPILDGNAEPVPGMAVAEDSSTPVHWNRLVQAFLAEGIVCGVLKPEVGKNFTDMAVSGAKIADLLILDWYLYDEGEAATEIIKLILRDPHRLTVIVIYTDASPAEIVSHLIDQCGVERISDFVLRQEAIRILVFSKPSILQMGAGAERTAEPSHLPRMICDDLEDHFGGLVPELAFSGINAIRQSVPRILGTFDSSLDAPLLTHRALLPDTSDASPQFIRLLTSELEISLMESSLTYILSDNSIRKRLNQSNIMKEPQLFTELHNVLKTSHHLRHREVSELVVEAVALGLQEMGLKEDALKDRSLKRLMNQLVACFGVGTEPHESLAVLMSSHQFGYIPPRLEAGVVMERDERYWLCIQPLCDSVRLTKSRKFPLLPLIINANENGSIKSRSAAMIWAANSKAVPVRFSSSVYDLEMPEFKPEENTLFVEAQEENGAWWFEDTEETRYRAVCRLRTEFTQQAVQGLTSGVARPGVDSSEWLRRQS